MTDWTNEKMETLRDPPEDGLDTNGQTEYRRFTQNTLDNSKWPAIAEEEK